MQPKMKAKIIKIVFRIHQEIQIKKVEFNNL